MKHFSIKYQILLISMIPVLLIDIFLTSLHINGSIEQATQLLKSKGEIIAQQIARGSEFYLFSGNYPQLQRLLDQTINRNDIVYSAVYDAAGNLVASAEGHDYSPLNSPSYFYYRQVIETQDIDTEDVFEPEVGGNRAQMRILGWVHLYISKHTLEQKMSAIFFNGLLFFVIMLVIAAGLTAIISHRITRPVFTLIDYLRKIEQGDLGEVIKNIKNNEIGEVQKGFNSMSQSLLAHRSQLNDKIHTATQELRMAVNDLEDKNRELGIARDDAQEANRVKSQFLANISHEIRTPINGIKGFVNLLADSGLQPDQRRYTDIIRQSTVDLSSIINEVLDFSKMESGKIDIQEDEFDLFDLVETTRDSLFTASMDKGIDLHLIIYSDTPRRLIGDPFRLKQILINLIGNAIKFTDAGHVSITVFMQDSSAYECTIQFKVTDSGIGISERDQKYLFQAFSQIESDSNRRYAGTGLGLVISKNLANLMGGDIELSSHSGNGSTFTLSLPFTPVEQAPKEINTLLEKTALIYAFNAMCMNEIQTLLERVGLATETQLLDGNSNIEQLSGQLQQNQGYLDFIFFDLRHNLVHPDNFFTAELRQDKRIIVVHYDITLIKQDLYWDYEFISVINTTRNIRKLLSKPPKYIEKPLKKQPEKPDNVSTVLIVDDNPINLALATELTRLWGHEAFEASHAKQAMTLFREYDFDLILLDIQMPEIDGVELMRMMRKERPDLPTPIVAITANIIDTERERLLNLGFDAFLDKPLEEAKLKALLNSELPLVSVQTPSSCSLESGPQPSLDLQLSMRLSGNNERLYRDMLGMLQQGIPDYRAQLQQACQNQSLGKLAYIVHKLQGVTCYTGLPRLKQLLARYDTVKHLDSEQTIVICKQIIDELDLIDVELVQALSDS